LGKLSSKAVVISIQLMYEAEGENQPVKGISLTHVYSSDVGLSEVGRLHEKLSTVPEQPTFPNIGCPMPLIMAARLRNFEDPKP
jgi:hypothetical protein